MRVSLVRHILVLNHLEQFPIMAQALFDEYGSDRFSQSERIHKTAERVGLTVGFFARWLLVVIVVKVASRV